MTRSQTRRPEGPYLYSLVHANLWNYWALAIISNGYSHVWGTLAMYYSPLRRSTHRISHPKDPSSCFRARLACLIHAASVHSEPGSNPSLLICDLSRSWIWVFLGSHRSHSNSLRDRVILVLREHRFRWIWFHTLPFFCRSLSSVRPHSVSLLKKWSIFLGFFSDLFQENTWFLKIMDVFRRRPQI